MFKKYFVLIIFLASYSATSALAINTIMITLSFDMDKIIFDGKWSSTTEWKRTSVNTIYHNNQTIAQLRTGHQDNFIYIFPDIVSDHHLDKGADNVVVCFDTENDKTTLPDNDDYCFFTSLDGKRFFVLQGGSPLGLNGHFKKISTPEDFIGIGGVSDENDPYNKIPHPGYEFRIPIELVDRHDIFGFYVGVYDAHTNKVYTWPEGITTNNPFEIPSPSKWGEIVSPDKSIPEFNFPIFILLSMIIVVLLGKNKIISIKK